MTITQMRSLETGQHVYLRGDSDPGKVVEIRKNTVMVAFPHMQSSNCYYPHQLQIKPTGDPKPYEWVPRQQ